jgi:hypothetical protein
VDGGVWQDFTSGPTGTTGYGIYVNGCPNTVVECHAFQASAYWGTDTSRLIKLDGGGGSGAGYTAIFGSDAGVSSATNGTLFEVTNQGKLVVTDHYYEGASPRIIRLTGSNTVTFSNDVYAPNAGGAALPPIELDTFTGTATFLNSVIKRDVDSLTNPQILVSGETSTTQEFFMGAEVDSMAAAFASYFSRTSSGGDVALFMSKYGQTAPLSGFPGGSYQVVDQGNPIGSPPSSFVTSSLNQTTTIGPTFPAISATGITEVRLIDVQMNYCMNCVQVGP